MQPTQLLFPSNRPITHRYRRAPAQRTDETHQQLRGKTRKMPRQDAADSATGQGDKVSSWSGASADLTGSNNGFRQAVIIIVRAGQRYRLAV